MSMTIYENCVIGRGGGASDAEAILLADGRIRVVGTLEQCINAATGATERVDLQGGFLSPGFIDAHVHTVQLATRSMELDVSEADGFAELALRVGQAMPGPDAVGLTKSGWMLGAGWNEGGWDDRRPASLTALDLATGECPTALHSGDLHAYWLNSAAIRCLGLNPDEVPDGLVREETAFAVQHEIERTVQDELQSRIADVLTRFLAVGVTGVHDIDNHIALDAFRHLADQQALPLRVHKLTIADELERVVGSGIFTGAGNEWLDYGGIKLFSDGSLGSHTCYLTEPFADRPDSRGHEALDVSQLRHAIHSCAKWGFSVAIHAIGDGAVRNALEALTTAPRMVVPNRIEHAQHIRREDLVRFERSGATAVMQPASCVSDIAMVQRRLGGRDLFSYPWRSLRNRGVEVAFSSDAPVENINPLAGIASAVTRQRVDGTPTGGWQPQERLSLAEAWRAYTLAPALAGGHKDRGRIAPGMLADLVVLDRDPRTVDDTALIQTQVLRTIVGGVTRWTTAA